MKRLSDALHPGARVFVAGVSGESALWLAELRADSERARGVHFIGVQFPGIDSADYLALHPDSRLTAFFMSPAVREGIRQGRAELLVLDYPGIARHLRDMAPVDVAVAQLSLPDADGYCSAGLASDFMPLVWDRALRRVAHLNPRLPRTRGSFRVHVSTLDIAVEADAPLLEYTEAAGGALEARIGAHIAGLVRDGDTLQFGVGSVPSALASSLASHRRLKLHSGMVSPAMQRLWEGGALDRDARITTGVALGPASFHAFVAEQPNLWFTDVARTHDVAAIAAIPRFVAINSAVEVDLFGQVNSERAGGAIQAGAGGLPAFAQGALASSGGQSMICLSSMARGGSVSRIVASLGDKALCTLPRYLADVVVTEHGVARLRGLGMDARAAALIGIAAPEHRDALAAQWDTLRRGL
ncbi:MAG TPA: acetyl-CoA hydrolase/transferase C-terminal domain-containing protein [Albitalea sp.]|nr:acetyl-CoA hydrolase/transferase C-terminal domain-containing protein [Albitalea sp.]